MNAYLHAMRNYAVFRGRAARSEFWFFTLVYLVISIVALLIDEQAGTTTDRAGVLFTLVQLVHFLPAIAVSVRRLHDIDRTGWWLLIALTGLGQLVLLIHYCTPTDPVTNRFGPPPADLPVRAGVEPARRLDPAPEPPQAPRDPIAEVERLAALRANGSLSEVEFEVMKTTALSQPRSR